MCVCVCCSSSSFPFPLICIITLLLYNLFHQHLENSHYLKKNYVPTTTAHLPSCIFLGKIVVRSIFSMSKACPVNYKRWTFLDSLKLCKHSCLPLWWSKNKKSNCSINQIVRANSLALGKLCKSPSFSARLCNEKKKKNILKKILIKDSNHKMIKWNNVNDTHQQLIHIIHH